MMPRTIALTCLAILTVALAASTAAQDATRPEPAAVEGRVIDRVTGSGLDAVTVTLTPIGGRGRAVRTGADGRFDMAGAAPGRYRVEISRSGYFPDRRSGPTTLTLAPGQLTEVLYELTPYGAVSGRVADEDGLPQGAVNVSAMRVEYQNGHRILERAAGPGASMQTFDDGVYRLYDIEPGDYYIQANPIGTGLQQLQRYYPDSVDPSDAVPITILPGGEQSGVNFRLSPKTAYTVSFKVDLPEASTVVLPPATTVHFTRVSPGGLAYPYWSAIRIAGRSANDTFLSRPLPPGSYDVYYGALTSFAAGHARIAVVDRDLDGITIPVRAGVDIVGRLIPAGPVASWNGAAVRIVFHPADPAMIALYGTTTLRPLPVRIEADGRFVTSMAMGRYFVDATGLSEDLYVQSARYGGIDVVNHWMTVEGDPPGPLDIVVAGPGGVAEGVVRDAGGIPVANARVVLAPQPGYRDNPFRFKAADTDQYGMFSMRGIPPGSYSVFAWEDVMPGAYLSPEFLEAFEARAERIVVNGGLTTLVNVRALPSPD